MGREEIRMKWEARIRHSVQVEKRQTIGVKPIKLIVVSFTHGSSGWTNHHFLL